MTKEQIKITLSWLIDMTEMYKKMYCSKPFAEANTEVIVFIDGGLQMSGACGYEMRQIVEVTDAELTERHDNDGWSRFSFNFNGASIFWYEKRTEEESWQEPF